MDDSSGDSSKSSRIPYFRLLNTLANDLDYMLNDLYTAPPSTCQISGDAFLEPYMQGVTKDLRHGAFNEVFDGSSNVFKRRDTDCSPSTDLSFSSPVDSVDTPSNEKLDFRLMVNAGSHGSLNQLISGDDCSENSSSAGSSAGDEETPCDITLIERLIRSHPIWFLPGIQRSGAFHLLQGKEVGNFVVRQSSQNSTMAISVRLPDGKGPYIEHYLIQGSGEGQIGLESSDNKFTSIPLLISHYCQCCDELPVQLTLPRAIREAKNRQQLTSLALLGQEFWRYPMANPRPSLKLENESPSPMTPSLLKDINLQMQSTSFMSGSSSSNSPASSLSSFESSNNNNNSGSSALETGTPFDVDTSSYHDESPQMSNMMSTFKKSPPHSSLPYNQIGIPVTEYPLSLPVEPSQLNQTVIIRRPRPTPPNTLNLISLNTTNGASDVSSATNSIVTVSRTVPSIPIQTTVTVTSPTNKTPPPPPPRSTKPTASNASNVNSQNFTVTTTLKFTVNKELSPPPDVEVQCIQVSGPAPPVPAARPLASSMPSIPPVPYPRTILPASKAQVLSPVSEGNTRPFNKRRRQKESHHYQESIIEYRPGVSAEKTSDGEDLYGSELSTFKPLPPPRWDGKKSTEDVHVNKNRFGMVLNTSCIDIVAMSAAVEKEEETTVVVSEPKTTEPVPQGSPFYAEPADALPGGRARNRHSEPPRWHPTAGDGLLERIDSREELLSGFSASAERLMRTPRCGAQALHKGNVWTVDTNWEFIAKDENLVDSNVSNLETEKNEKFGEELLKKELEQIYHSSTVQEMISQRLPNLRLSPVYKRTSPKPESSEKQDTSVPEKTVLNERLSNGSNNESFDSGEKFYHYNGLSVLSQISDTSDTQTEFSEPWDSSRWEHLLSSSPKPNEIHNPATRCRSFKERLDPLLSPPRIKALSRNRVSTSSAPGAGVRAYAFYLAANKETVFAQSIERFIRCTRESRETKPQVVMRNIRQFMSGMKNYLVKHGEGEFEKEVDRERSKLKSTEFLNLDAILEGVMHKLVVTPLKDHLYQLFVDEYMENGAIELLTENMQYARTKPAQELGIRDKIVLPADDDLQKIFDLFNSLQTVDSPLEKLECLLSAIATIFHSVKISNKDHESVLLGADDFLPIFIWVLVQSGMIAAEIEAEYMWGLLHPSLLSGEGGYYLTTLSSAVNVLKNFRICSNKDAQKIVPWCHDPLSEFRSVLKVVVPDEMNGSLLTKTLPVRPNMTTRDICKIIALKLRITNPQDYSLFKLVDGEETLLNDSDSPQDVKTEITGTGKHCIFAYKRIDAKIAWPRTTSPDLA